LGDLFFTLAQYARHIGEDPEQIARSANEKFLNRVRSCEKLALNEDKTFLNASREDKEQYWKKVKQDEKVE